VTTQKQVITIKGTKDGLIFLFDEYCSFYEIIRELEEKLTSSLIENEHPLVKVTIHLGNRYLTNEMKNEIEQIFQSKKNFIVEKFTSNVMHRQEAEEMIQKLEITPIKTIVRSGQVVHVDGDALLIGDVNPGGKITASGNIYVLGKLYGIAHAGIDGDRNAIVVASYMNPTQLRIADLFSRSPDYETEGVSLEYAYIDQENEVILIDRLQRLSKIGPITDSFERRIING
jgi:septum site-determining protein MinC